LGPARSWWPDFLFRVDDLEAAARILNCGYLLSRTSAASSGVLIADAASPEVIAATNARWKNFVRLYFRPRTPTQYHSEGFRTLNHYGLRSRCPAPVVMLFDAADILTRAETTYSSGNLAAEAPTGSDASFLTSVPFQTVYHDSWFDPNDRGTIIFHRHAEVIVPDKLLLDPLRFIGCRSQAEYESLLFLLNDQAKERWSKKIGLGVKANLHFRQWSFVENVVLERARALFRFNPSTKSAGPFTARVDVQETTTGKTHYWESTAFVANTQLDLGLSSLTSEDGYSIRLRLDGALAYANRYEAADIVF
jgi:ssDNA thymidine ADP-ribosyltransferase DarT-like protein